MATGLAFDFDNAAQWIQRLGNVPLYRVRMRPLPGTATERDVIALHDRYNRLFELVDGTLVEKAMGFRESLLAVSIAHLLKSVLDENNLGIVAGADGMLRLLGKFVRIPDVSFISWDRLPGRKVPRAPIPELVPNLAVEVLSEGNTAEEMERKLKEYFLAGVHLVWLVDPVKQTVEVFTAPDRSRLRAGADLLMAEGVLPGLIVPVRSIFEGLPEEEEAPAGRKRRTTNPGRRRPKK